VSQDHSRAIGPQVKDKVKVKTAAAVKAKEIIVRKAAKDQIATDQAKAAVRHQADKVLEIVHKAAKAAIALPAAKAATVRQVKAAAPANVRALVKAAIAVAADKTVPLAAAVKIAAAKAAALRLAAQAIVLHRLLRKDKAAALIPEARNRALALMIASTRTRQEAETDKNVLKTAVLAVLEETATAVAKAEANSRLHHVKRSTIHRKKLLYAVQ
jgi:hypothetical protein